MDLLYSLKKLFGKRRAENDLDAEIQFHLEMSVEQKVANGMDPEAARKEALREFGGVEQAKEKARDSWGLQFLYTCWKDIQFGWRQLMKNKKHAAIIVLTLAICMGANTTAYNLVMNLVANPYDYKETDRIVAIGRIWPKEESNTSVGSLSVAQYRFIEEHSDSFSSMALSDGGGYDLALGGRIHHVEACRTTTGAWEVTGVQPVVGHFYTEEDVESSAGKVVVLGESLWNELRTPENNLIGERITLDGHSYEVLGVAPQSFLFGFRRADIYTPYTQSQLKQFRYRFFPVIGKLKPGITHVQANQELMRLYNVFAEQDSSEKEDHIQFGATFSSKSINQNFINSIGPTATPFRIFQLVTLVVLIIGCLNVAGMIMVRSYSRLQEFAMRRALGASIGRLSRQMLIEILLYFILGGLGSLLVLKAGYVAAERMMGLGDIPWAGELSIDFNALIVTVLAAVAAAILTGFLPIIGLLRRDLLGLVKAGGQTVGGSVGKHRMHAFFVIAQVALSVLLLVGAGFLIRNLHATLQKEIGFSTESRVAVEIPQPGYRFGTDRKSYLTDVLPFQQRVLECLRAMPGVVSAAACNRVPISDANTRISTFSMHHYEYAPGESAQALQMVVHPRYFKTMNIRLLMGRDFESTDTMDTAGVVIISQSLMKKYYKGLDPVGMQIEFGGRNLRIIGVAEQVQNMAFSVARDLHTLYFPSAQCLDSYSTVYVAHVEGNPKTQLKNLEKAILDLDLRVAIGSRTIDEVYKEATFIQWFPMRLSLLFASIALFLTGLGLYGLISFIVAERTREYGIRMALGAQPARIVKRIMSRSGRLIGWGLVIGLVLAGVLGWKINPLMPDVDTTAPLQYAVVAGFVLVVCLLAALLPARRVTKINPMEALRAE